MTTRPTAVGSTTARNSGTRATQAAPCHSAGGKDSQSRPGRRQRQGDRVPDQGLAAAPPTRGPAVGAVVVAGSVIAMKPFSATPRSITAVSSAAATSIGTLRGIRGNSHPTLGVVRYRDRRQNEPNVVPLLLPLPVTKRTQGPAATADETNPTSIRPRNQTKPIGSDLRASRAQSPRIKIAFSADLKPGFRPNQGSRRKPIASPASIRSVAGREGGEAVGEGDGPEVGRAGPGLGVDAPASSRPGRVERRAVAAVDEVGAEPVAGSIGVGREGSAGQGFKRGADEQEEADQAARRVAGQAEDERPRASRPGRGGPTPNQIGLPGLTATLWKTGSTPRLDQGRGDEVRGCRPRRRR